MPELTPNLWFDTQAKEAAEFYCEIFPNSRITNVSYYSESGPGETGSVVTVDFELDGKRFTGINGGPAYSFTPAVSFLIDCKDQAEVDYYWDRLLAGGGEPSQCGWLADRYGVSWQVVPARLGELMTGADPEAVDRVTKAFLQMQKFDVAELERAAAGAGD
ncbi:VOC family protein [Microlunatus sp. Gsoil 973]|uniref:VOC family protein n=1 Tax=Microlunatus sp. Gsoil 973 TaxID=2672569 RepID=UPI0012B4D1DE|nr:VOC family protein [Microlunatus sp. Gsoil 973]QGN32809.1 VOC family protein [Microlunatus sp. Gsoil 973]